MYLDPPYPGNKCNYAHNMRGWDEHHLLAKRLKSATCKWILSSYDIPEMHSLFSDHFILGVQSASGMNVEKNGGVRSLNKEVLITNYAPPKSLLLKQKEATSAQPTLELEAAAPYKVSDPANLVLLSSPPEDALPASMTQ